MIYDTLKKLCKANVTSINKLEHTLNIARGSLCKIDTNKPSVDKLQKLADYFSVSIDYLLNGGNGISSELTSKDERDIAKDLDRIMGEIKKGNDEPLYYNGIEIDDASIGLLQNAIEYALRETKKENKVKYNPNKNKK